MLLHRIYLGGDNRKGGARFDEAAVVDAVSAYHPDGFTLLRAIGYWRGKAEQTWIIEILAEAHDVKRTAESLRVRFNQEAVAFAAVGNLELVGV